jgi:streptomycin 6-kinase
VGTQATPAFDDEVRRRLARRYGPEVAAWFETLPARLSELAHEWQVELGPLIQRGSVSVVVTCRLKDGGSAVLKISPDLRRIAIEGASLIAWHTPHVPKVIAQHADHGALLMEAIRPGTALDQSGDSPSTWALAALVRALHDTAPPVPTVPPVTDRIAALFGAGEANYARRPDLLDVVPRELYDRGQRAALALAADTSSGQVVLHGDLTAVNVLDGGTRRGLVAIDPAPCSGDPAFDTVDLLMWQVADLAGLTARATDLGARLDLSCQRMLQWCAAFAPMEALERAAATPPGSARSGRLRMLLELAERN